MSSSELVTKKPPMKRSTSDGDLSSSSEKKAKPEEDEGLILGSESAPVNPPHVRCSIISRTTTDTHEDAADFPPPSMTMRNNHRGNANIFATPRFFELSFDRPPKRDPKLDLDKAWGLLKPAIRCIFLDVDPYSFHCEEIFRAVNQAWLTKSGEALNKLILDECGTYISKDIESFAEHCNDDDPSLFLSLLEKSWLDFRKKMEFLCTFAGNGRKLEHLVLELFPTHVLLVSQVRDKVLSIILDQTLVKSVDTNQLNNLMRMFNGDCIPTHLFSNSQVRDKVLSIILDLIRDQRLGKSVDTSQLDNLMLMFNGKCFHNSSFLEKPFLDSATEFYAAEAMQVLEQSDVPQYLKFVERRLGEEKSKCRELYFFSKFRYELIEIVTRELLGVHACAILEKGFEKLVDEMHWEDLGRMYDLFSEADLVHHINDALRSYILKTGEKISSEGSSLEEFMARVNKFFTSYFREDPMLEKTLETYFEGLGLPWKDRNNVYD